MDVVIQAMSGIMETTGFDDKPPSGAGAPIADVNTGMFGAIGILAALLGRYETKTGAYVDVSMLDTLASVMSSIGVRQLNGLMEKMYPDGKYPRANGSRRNIPFSIYKCKDGRYVSRIAYQPHFYKVMWQALGRPEMIADERFQGRNRVKNKKLFVQTLEEVLSTKNMQEWVEILRNVGVPAAPVNDMKGAVNEEQLKHRNMIVETTDGVKLIGNPVKILGYPDNPTKLTSIDNLKTDINTLLAKL